MVPNTVLKNSPMTCKGLDSLSFNCWGDEARVISHGGHDIFPVDAILSKNSDLPEDTQWPCVVSLFEFAT